MKLIFCTKGSMRVLNTWATSGPAESALTSTCSPAAFCAVRAINVGRRRADGQGVQQLGQPHARLGRNADHRDQAALGDGPLDQSRQFLFGGRRALEVAFHDRFIHFDHRFQERLAELGRIDQGAGGVGGQFQRAGHAAEIGPRAQRHVQQHARLAEHLLDVLHQDGEIDVLARPSC